MKNWSFFHATSRTIPNGFFHTFSASANGSWSFYLKHVGCVWFQSWTRMSWVRPVPELGSRVRYTRRTKATFSYRPNIRARSETRRDLQIEGITRNRSFSPLTPATPPLPRLSSSFDLHHHSLPLIYVVGRFLTLKQGSGGEGCIVLVSSALAVTLRPS